MTVRFEPSGTFGKEGGDSLEFPSRDTGRGTYLVENDEILFYRLGCFPELRTPWGVAVATQDSFDERGSPRGSRPVVVEICVPVLGWFDLTAPR